MLDAPLIGDASAQPNQQCTLTSLCKSIKLAAPRPVLSMPHDEVSCVVWYRHAALADHLHIMHQLQILHQSGCWKDGKVGSAGDVWTGVGAGAGADGVGVGVGVGAGAEEPPAAVFSLLAWAFSRYLRAGTHGHAAQVTK
jgi:hypothetical protein